MEGLHRAIRTIPLSIIVISIQRLESFLVCLQSNGTDTDEHTQYHQPEHTEGHREDGRVGENDDLPQVMIPSRRYRIKPAIGHRVVVVGVRHLGFHDELEENREHWEREDNQLEDTDSELLADHICSVSGDTNLSDACLRVELKIQPAWTD